MMRATLWALPAVFAVYMPTCTTPTVRPTMPPSQAHQAELWEAPTDLANRDLVQWEDAFRAGGFEPAVAARFIRRLHQKIADGERLPG